MTFATRTSAGAVRRPSITTPFAIPLDLVLVRDAQHAHLVLTGHAVARMRQLRGKVAVAGQDDEPLGLVVQPAHRVDVFTDAVASQMSITVGRSAGPSA